MRKIKALLGILLLVALIMAASGCGPKAIPPTTSEPGEKTIKIAYIPMTYETADFYGQYHQGMVKGLDELGIKYELLVRAPSSTSAHDQQLSIVEDMITAGVDFIVLAPTSYEGQQAAYRKINESGIPLIIANYSQPFPADFRATALSFVGYQHSDGGLAVANYIKDNYPKGTKMAIIHGTPMYSTFERGARDHHVVNGMDVVSEQFADWDRAKAYDTAQRLITAYPDLKIIVATSSHMAIGAVEAIASEGLTGKIDVFGAGAILEELDHIEKGTLKGSWYRDPIKMGENTAESIWLHLNGRTNEIPQAYNVPIGMITSVKDIIEQINPITYTSVGRQFPK
ncbi:MAG: sugar ABC transporter substrate-binding protein [Dethiobacter sp.]|jgi:ABC-type sugar transport system substrate-binding protein|nr:sugar ABC transporter substrate-binding protein [Dethiobacter sp.]